MSPSVDSRQKQPKPAPIHMLLDAVWSLEDDLFIYTVIDRHDSSIVQSSSWMSCAAGHRPCRLPGQPIRGKLWNPWVVTQFCCLGSKCGCRIFGYTMSPPKQGFTQAFRSRTWSLELQQYIFEHFETTIYTVMKLLLCLGWMIGLLSKMFRLIFAI